ncbi:CopD family protein [Rhodobacteraceae bacterium M385]|nr:CopD family protein [Rhodobacteraceae bacterium M385]
MEWVKVIHLLCVLGWMTGIFAAPRALIFWKREWAAQGAFGPTGDLTIRIYRFSLGLGVVAVLSGLYLAHLWGWPTWSLLKFCSVALLAGHYGWTGRLILRARQGIFTESDRWLRIYNEISVLGVIGILILVVYKPF